MDLLAHRIVEWLEMVVEMGIETEEEIQWMVIWIRIIAYLVSALLENYGRNLFHMAARLETKLENIFIVT